MSGRPAWPFVAELIELESTPSTSDHARSLVLGVGLSPPPPLPFAVRTARQTRGRGRGRHTWWSDAGSLAVTLALDPHAHGLRPDHESRLALATAVALIAALDATARPRMPLGIRWPNDVEAGGKKLAGLLPERVDTPDGPRILIGVGVNVRTQLDAAPPEVRRMATSVADIAANGPDLDTVLSAFLDALATILPRLATDDPGLAARWAELDTLAGQPVRILLGAETLVGQARGIDPAGALLVATADRGPIPVFGGQVLRDDPAA